VLVEVSGLLFGELLQYAVLIRGSVFYYDAIIQVM
jgi:hypothetical protein